MSTGEMRLRNMEFERLLPQFMRGDLAVLGLSHGLDKIVRPESDRFKMLSTWDQIDNLSEEELDALSWELNTLWYDKDADIRVKRDLLKNSDKVYMHLGTKWAVENVISAVFGEGYIKEWFEYDGTPGYFRVYSTNPNITDSLLTKFMSILNKVKRHSSKLEGIFITLTGEMHLAAGWGFFEATNETYAIGATPPEEDSTEGGTTE